LSFSKIKYDTYNDDLQPEVYISWQKKVLKECCRILKDDGSIFYNHMDILNNHLTIHPSFVYDFNIKQILIWNRSNTPKLDNNYFYPINEWIFWIKENKQSKTKFFRKKCVFQKSIISLKPNVKNNHPAPFPLQLANNFILSCTDKNDIVYDPFIGSGTTAIASIINNRNYIGSEISKNYVNIANKRIKPYLTQTKLF
jgi:DNA modification methylase